MQKNILGEDFAVETRHDPRGLRPGPLSLHLQTRPQYGQLHSKHQDQSQRLGLIDSLTLGHIEVPIEIFINCSNLSLNCSNRFHHVGFVSKRRGKTWKNIE